jgi:hypothetical protein
MIKHPVIHPPFQFHSFTSSPFSVVRTRSFWIGSLLIDKVEVSRIDDGIEKIGSDKDWVHLPKGISQEDQSTSQAEIPEGHRDNAFFPLFRGDPLDDEPHRKHRLPDETENQPEVQLELWISHRKVLQEIGHETKK